MTTVQLISQTHLDGKYLGRHIEHDPKSWEFQAPTASKIKTVFHQRRCAPFNQGNIGSCTGNAAAGALMTDPDWQPGRALTEADALAIYELATKLDGYPGEYPPDDTGSSGLGAARAAKKLGYIRSYRHAFGLDQAMHALMLRPTITGAQWKTGFDNPDAHGLVEFTGSIRGGHEFVQVGYDAVNDLVWNYNSWGEWGVEGPDEDASFGTGMFCFSSATWGQLLAAQGDVMTMYG